PLPFSSFLFFFLTLRHPPISTLFPYTTLFRSDIDRCASPFPIDTTIATRIVARCTESFRSENSLYRQANDRSGREGRRVGRDRGEPRRWRVGGHPRVVAYGAPRRLRAVPASHTH